MEELTLFTIANFSFERAEQVIEKLIGVFISKSALHEIFKRTEPEEPKLEEKIEEISLDGGSVCVEKADWKQYKAVRVNKKYYAARYQENDKIIDWINSQESEKPIICLGDGHDGVWNIFDEIKHQKIEILDWYHLKENLYKQKFEKDKLKELETDLWKGRVNEVIDKLEEGNNFRKYVLKHKERIVNYGYYQMEGITIGSGAVESAVKQINARLNLPGARWKSQNVNKILSLRCSFLNST